MTIYVSGVGAALPQREVSNEAFAALVGMEPERIARLGIERRFIADSREHAARLALQAAREALSQADAGPETLQAIVVASANASRQSSFVTAEGLRDRLEMPRAQPVDINTSRMSFHYALALARVLLEAAGRGQALVLGGEAPLATTGVLRDRRRCYMYSDGAGALVLDLERGFARLGDPVWGRVPLESASRDRALRRSRTEEIGLSLTAEDASRTSLAAALAELDTEPDSGPWHVLSEELRSADEQQAEEARIFNPLAGTGFLLGAGPPVLLHRFLHARLLDDGGARALLFSTDGRGSWGHSALSIERRPELAASAMSHAELGRDAWLPPELIRVDSPQELERLLIAESQRARDHRAASYCLTVKLETGRERPAVMLERLGEEAGSSLRANLRAFDRVFRLGTQPAFAVLLRHHDDFDAENLKGRLRRLLERLDPAGELRIGVDLHGFPFSARQEERGAAAAAEQLSS